jgi:hypothetical protein
MPVASELEKTHTGNGTSEKMTLQHPTRAQVLEDERVKLSVELGQKFMKGIFCILAILPWSLKSFALAFFAS